MALQLGRASILGKNRQAYFLNYLRQVSFPLMGDMSLEFHSLPTSMKFIFLPRKSMKPQSFITQDSKIKSGRPLKGQISPRGKKIPK